MMGQRLSRVGRRGGWLLLAWMASACTGVPPRPGPVLATLPPAASPQATAGAYSHGADLSALRSTDSRTIINLTTFQQTTDYTCGPCSIRTLLKFHGRDRDEIEIATEAGSTTDKGTTPECMVRWLNNNGFTASYSEGRTLELLRENLAKNIPTVIEWIDWGGHWVVVVGYDTMGTDTVEDDIIVFADPYDAADGHRDGMTCFNADRFYCMWFDAFYFDKPMHRVYISAVPKAP